MRYFSVEMLILRIASSFQIIKEIYILVTVVFWVVFCAEYFMLL